MAGLPDERLGQRLVLFSEEQRTNSEERLIIAEEWDTVWDMVRAELGPYSVPKKRIALGRFVETPTGKIDRNGTVRAWLAGL